MSSAIKAFNVIFLSITLLACGGGEDDSGAGGSSNSTQDESPFTSNTVILKDADSVVASQMIQRQTTQTASSQSNQGAQDCGVIADNYQGSTLVAA